MAWCPELEIHLPSTPAQPYLRGMEQETSDQGEAKSYAPIFLKGLAVVLLGIPLAIGVAWAGDGNIESWGSALIGVLFLVMVLMTSGTNGWWDRD